MPKIIPPGTHDESENTEGVLLAEDNLWIIGAPGDDYPIGQDIHNLLHRYDVYRVGLDVYGVRKDGSNEGKRTVVYDSVGKMCWAIISQQWGRSWKEPDVYTSDPPLSGKNISDDLRRLIRKHHVNWTPQRLYYGIPIKGPKQRTVLFQTVWEMAEILAPIEG